MARPKSKSELVSLSNKNFSDLIDQIHALPPEKLKGEFPPGTMNRNIRDVLAHLHVWHVMMLDWYNVGMAGRKPSIPADGYTWKTVPALNREIWEKSQGFSLEDCIERIQKSHQKVSALIEKHTDEELFTKKLYPWTGSTSLGAYLISATSSHYDWGLKLIKKATK